MAQPPRWELPQRRLDVGRGGTKVYLDTIKGIRERSDLAFYKAKPPQSYLEPLTPFTCVRPN